MGPSGISSNGSFAVTYNGREMKENIIECTINTVLRMVSRLKFTVLLHICLLAPWLAETEDEEGGREGSILRL